MIPYYTSSAFFLHANASYNASPNPNPNPNANPSPNANPNPNPNANAHTSTATSTEHITKEGTTKMYTDINFFFYKFTKEHFFFYQVPKQKKRMVFFSSYISLLQLLMAL